VKITTRRAAVLTFLVVASVTLFFFTQYSADNDPAGTAIAEYIRQNERVMEQAGTVVNADFVRRVSVGPNGPGGYRVYTFIVSGTKAKVTVVVRAESLDGEQPRERYSIESIDP